MMSSMEIVLSLYFLKQTDSTHIAVLLFSSRSQKTLKCVKNTTLIFLSHFDVIFVLLLNRHIGLSLKSLVAHYCQSLSRFPYHEATRNIATPPGWDAGTHLYCWMERGNVRVKCLAQEHKTMTRPGLEPGPLDPEYSALTTRALRLPHIWTYGNMEYIF